MTEEKEFFSIDEFAKLLGLHHQTIRTSIKKGRIIAFRIGFGKKAALRIARSEINRIAELDLEDIIDKLIDKRMGK